MSCPYLAVVTMSFCRAFPVKKLVPTGGVLTDSACEGDCFATCPVYRDALVQLGGAPQAVHHQFHSAAPQGGKS
jgi:hypothetical protein